MAFYICFKFDACLIGDILSKRTSWVDQMAGRAKYISAEARCIMSATKLAMKSGKGPE